MVKLRRVYETNLYLESKKDLDDLKNYLGDKLFDDYMKIRDRIPKDQNEFKDFSKLKKLPIKDIQDFVSSFQSKSDKKKQDKTEGAKKLYEDDKWVVYKITSYPAAQLYGKNTKWCITGRYPGHEERGQEYFDSYIEDNNLDGGYYFYLNKKDPKEKYCILQTKDNRIHSIWNAEDEVIGGSYSELLEKGVSLPEVKEVHLPKHTMSLNAFFKTLDRENGEDLFNYYLENGFDVNAVDEEGRTYLFRLIEDRKPYSNKTKKKIKFLLDKGANPNIKNSTDQFMLAYVNDDVDVLNLLLEYGANPNIKNAWGNTPLHYSPNRKVAELLLNSGVDIDAKNTIYGETPLMVCVNAGKYKMIEFLLNKGADVNLPNDGGVTPLYEAVVGEDEDIVNLLLDKGANPNKETKRGWYPIHKAIGDENKHLIKLLLEHGADVNVKTSKGLSLIQFSENIGNKDIINLLKEYGAKE